MKAARAVEDLTGHAAVAWNGHNQAQCGWHVGRGIYSVECGGARAIVGNPKGASGSVGHAPYIYQIGICTQRFVGCLIVGDEIGLPEDLRRTAGSEDASQRQSGNR